MSVETYVCYKDDAEVIRMIQDNKNGTAIIATVIRNKDDKMIDFTSLKRVRGAPSKMETYLFQYRHKSPRNDVIGSEILHGDLEDSLVWDIEYFEDI